MKRPFDLQNDALITLNFLRSMSGKQRDELVSSIDPTEDPEIFIAKVKLKNGKIGEIIMKKRDRWSTWWDLEYEGVKISYPKESLTDPNTRFWKRLGKDLVDQIDYIAHRLNSFDFTYAYSDNPGAFRSGNEMEKKMRDHLKTMSKSDLSKVYKKLSDSAKKHFEASF